MSVLHLRFARTGAGCSLRGQPSALREFAGWLRNVGDRLEVPVRSGVIEVRHVEGEPLRAGLNGAVLSLSGGRSVLVEFRQTVEALADEAERGAGGLLAHAHYENHGPDDDHDVAAGSMPLLVTGDWPWGPGAAAAFGPLVEAMDWSGDVEDESTRHELVLTAVRRGLPGNLVRDVLAGEPRQTLPALVNAALEVVDDDEHAAWLALVPAAATAECSQRSDEVLLVRRANRGGLGADEARAAMDSWTDKFQRRLSEELVDPELLGLLADHGKTKRIRQAADLRRAQLLGRPLSESELMRLLDALCTRMGYCLPPPEIERLGAEAPHDVEGFTDAVLLAEGLDPLTHDSLLRAQVRRLVAASFDRERQLRSQL